MCLCVCVCIRLSICLWLSVCLYLSVSLSLSLFLSLSLSFSLCAVGWGDWGELSKGFSFEFCAGFAAQCSARDLTALLQNNLTSVEQEESGVVVSSLLTVLSAVQHDVLCWVVSLCFGDCAFLSDCCARCSVDVDLSCPVSLSFERVLLSSN